MGSGASVGKPAVQPLSPLEERVAMLLAAAVVADIRGVAVHRSGALPSAREDSTAVQEIERRAGPQEA